MREGGQTLTEVKKKTKAFYRETRFNHDYSLLHWYYSTTDLDDSRGSIKISKSLKKNNPLIFMDDIKVFAEMKKNGDHYKPIKICIEMEFSVQMFHADNERWIKRISGHNKTNKSRMNLNKWKEGNQQVLGILGNVHHLSSEMKEALN